MNPPETRTLPPAPPEDEQRLRYKIAFLNSIFLLAALIALGLGFYRLGPSPRLAAFDFGYAGAAFALLFVLHRFPARVEGIATTALVLSYVLFFAIFLMAPYQTNRLSLFFLLSAAAFFLKGLRIGVAWLAFIVASLLGAHWLDLSVTRFSTLDIVTTCLYLGALFAIFYNYETLKEEQHRRERERGVEKLIDERWRLALEGAGDAVWDWDVAGRRFTYSKSFAAMLGYREEEIGHDPGQVGELLHAADREATLGQIKAYLAGEFGGQFVSEHRMRCADGSYKWVLARGRIADRDALGRPRRIVGTHVDITERKRTEAILVESELRLHLALDSARMGAWEYDLASQRLYWSPEVFRLFGLPVFEPTLEKFQALIHPEDLDGVQRGFDDALRERKPFFAEFRFGPPEKPRWAGDFGEIQYDAEGKPVRAVGVVQDITERKRAEAEVLLSRQALADERGLFQTILDNSPLGIWMVDTSGRVQFVNHAFCAATGVTEARFLAAASYAEVLPADVAANCAQSDRECLEQEAPHVSLERLPAVDGREHLMEITKVRLLNRDGSLRGLIGLAVDVTERMEHERQLEHMAHYDSLTGVPNRALLADRLRQALARAKRERGLMAVCYIDLDGFKPINDRLGHEAGDRVLVEVTRRIREAVREEDTVARLGGDEFVVLLVGLQQPEECVGSLQRLLDRVNQPIQVQGESLSVSASIGVALYPEDEQDADTLLRHADQAMYIAKQAGRNRYHLFDAASDQRARSHHELLQQIRRGLGAGEFELFYQPKVDMATRRMVGAEALIRWRHPQRGLLAPGEFLRAIDNTELEIELGEWVIRNAASQLRRWRSAGHDFEVSINISAYHLQAPDFARKLREALPCRRPQGCHHCLQIEVLETSALEDTARIADLIRECRQFGIGFALDDFGTGYSSLTYLSKLDVDTLKIDQSFIRDMERDKGDHAVVQGIIALARAFEMKVVAEGVETEGQYQALLAMGCGIAQGYGIARPMPVAELEAWLAKSSH